MKRTNYTTPRSRDEGIWIPSDDPYGGSWRPERSTAAVVVWLVCCALALAMLFAAAGVTP